jgi:hypothetical protein
VHRDIRAANVVEFCGHQVGLLLLLLLHPHPAPGRGVNAAPAAALPRGPSARKQRSTLQGNSPRLWPAPQVKLADFSISRHMRHGAIQPGEGHGCTRCARARCLARPQPCRRQAGALATWATPTAWAP